MRSDTIEAARLRIVELRQQHAQHHAAARIALAEAQALAEALRGAGKSDPLVASVANGCRLEPTDELWSLTPEVRAYGIERATSFLSNHP